MQCFSEATLISGVFMCWHGILVCKLGNLPDAFLALMLKKQKKEKQPDPPKKQNPTVKQNPECCKGLQRRRKTKEKRGTPIKQKNRWWCKSCYNFHVQALLSVEGSTGSVSFRVHYMHSHPQFTISLSCSQYKLLGMAE